jgi:predicted anti-sigma-YlaC factor YlaD
MYHRFSIVPVAFFLIFALALTSCTSTTVASGGSDGAGTSFDSEAIPPKGFTLSVIGKALPGMIKSSDKKLAKQPGNMKKAITAASYHVMYANAVIQADAQMLPVSQFDLQNAEYIRAQSHYITARDQLLDAFDFRNPGFKDTIMSGDAAKIDAALSNLTKDDVDAAYWMGAGWLAAFSLDPLNDELLSNMNGAVALLEKANEFDGEYNNGAIWNILCAFYAAAPADFGGDPERALFCYEESLRISQGKLPDPYVTYAESICISTQDIDGFEKALTAALAIKKREIPRSSRLASSITQRKARWLLDHKDNYFVVWE